MKHISIYILFLCLFFSCKNESKPMDFSHIPEAFSIEIVYPAGVSNTQTFLPFPGNMGYLDEEENMAVLVLSEAADFGETMAVRPLGTLILKEKNQLKQIIIASPLDSLQQLSQTTNFQEFIAKNAGEKQIIQDWFLYQKGIGTTELVGWKDEKYALDLIRKNE